MKLAWISNARRDRDGAVGIMLALFLSVCVSLTALAIDMGSLYLERRTLQGAADLAAVAAASDLTHAEAAARATLKANGLGEIRSLSVIRGRYENGSVRATWPAVYGGRAAVQRGAAGGWDCRAALFCEVLHRSTRYFCFRNRHQ
jgi:uncharacterized membrane protein